MSVNFRIVNAPEEEYLDEDVKFIRPVPPFFEINLSNDNAADIMAMIDPELDPFMGVWPVSALGPVRSQLVKLLTSQGKSQLVKPDQWHARDWFEQGRDMNYVVERLVQFIDLVSLAMANQMEVEWY